MWRGGIQVKKKNRSKTLMSGTMEKGSPRVVNMERLAVQKLLFKVLFHGECQLSSCVCQLFLWFSDVLDAHL